MLGWSSLPSPTHTHTRRSCVSHRFVPNRNCACIAGEIIMPWTVEHPKQLAATNNSSSSSKREKYFNFLHTGKRQIDETEYSKSQRRKENTISRCVGLWKSGFQFTLQEKRRPGKRKAAQIFAIYDAQTYLQPTHTQTHPPRIRGVVRK